MIPPLKRQDPRWLLIRARHLDISRGEVLAEFERTVIAEAHQRVVREGGVLTPAERQVVEDAVDAMVAAGRQGVEEGLAA